MVFQKLLGKLGSQIKLVGLSLILLLSFVTANVASAVTIPTINQPVQHTSSLKNEDLLLAASTRLTALFDSAVFSSGRSVMEKRIYRYYDEAYSSEWDWFDYITTGSLRGPYYSDTGGYIYVRDLIGGGTANIRQRGSSGNYPTIDTLRHNSPSPYSSVVEVKFKY